MIEEIERKESGKKKLGREREREGSRVERVADAMKRKASLMGNIIKHK